MRKCSKCGKPGHNKQTCKITKQHEEERRQLQETRDAWLKARRIERQGETLHALVTLVNELAEQAGVGSFWLDIDNLDVYLQSDASEGISQFMDVESAAAVYVLAGAIRQARGEER